MVGRPAAEGQPSARVSGSFRSSRSSRVTPTNAALNSGDSLADAERFVARGRFASNLRAPNAPLGRSDITGRVARLPAMLDALRALGRRRVNRVHRLLLGAALALSAVELACAALAWRARAAEPAAALALLTAMLVCALAALPCILAARDAGRPHAERGALGACAAAHVGYAAAGAVWLARLGERAACARAGAAQATASRACALDQQLVALAAVVTAACAVLALLAARAAVAPRASHAWPEAHWRAVGACCGALGLVGLVLLGLHLAAAAPGAADAGLLAACAGLAAVASADAALASSARLRSRARAYVAVRGEAVERATVVAAMLGGRSTVDALAIARASFRSIQLSALRRSDFDLPDAAAAAGGDDDAPARMYALSVPAQLGDVDAFVSHSWHDDPATKVRPRATRRDATRCDATQRNAAHCSRSSGDCGVHACSRRTASPARSLTRTSAAPALADSPPSALLLSPQGL